ncbi:flagellar motor switch protein FliG [Candidatus Termititenax persephonae]|uniref:Flagellar motor switch protein FliG n=1 Tax=Candidatus Termititenax persephonae TaxID=2218525 RepID=A0A388TEX4_9BACT|nr:flagellar motor switch protein FliG [Candidatus Termititenax persephonae]
MVVMQLKGKEKALVFLATLGDEVSRKVLSCLPDKLSGRIAHELNKFKKPSPEAVAFVLKELVAFSLEKQPERPQLEAPPEQVKEEIDPIDATSELGRMPLPELVAFLQNEMPQTAAFVLSHLSPARQNGYYELVSPGRRSEIKQCVVEKTPWADSVFAALNERAKAGR